MSPTERAIAKLRTLPQIVFVGEPDPADLEAFLDEENGVNTMSEMPMENRALADVMSREHRIVVAFSDALDGTAHHEVIMVDGSGRTVGWDVPRGLEHEVEGRDDLVWMGDDFVMDPAVMGGEVRVVLLAQSLGIIGRDEGADRPVAMFPSPSTDAMLRERYGISTDPRYATAIVAFDGVR